MDAVLLAAGYGTRLSRDLEFDGSGRWRHLVGVPKPLLPIGHLPLISHWLASLQELCKRICVITNSCFFKQFQAWQNHLDEELRNKVQLLNDGSENNQTRLGAVKDIQLALISLQEENDVLIVAGDTLFYEDFSLLQFFAQFQRLKEANEQVCLIVHAPCPEDRVEKHGILEVRAEDGRVLNFLEKPSPKDTKSRLQSPCFYLLSSSCKHQVTLFLQQMEGRPLEERDATGHWIKFLINQVPVYSFPTSGRFDVGDLDSYIICHQHFTQTQVQP